LRGRHRILVASTNPGKLAEIRAMLGGDIEWVSLSDFPGIPEIEEDGATFAENARKKALGYAKATRLWTLADDSGLVVDALGGQPGVKSARFADFHRPLPTTYRGRRDRKERRDFLDKKNIEKLLAMLKDVPKEKRSARFVCCLCLATPDKVLAETTGTLEGVIVDEPMGDNGFGYDPVFFVPKLDRTVAQLNNVEKNAISHRGNAIIKLKKAFTQLKMQF
jgi:XTP/dITP diphosphohydrolase